MLQPRSIQSSLGLRDKILSLDFILIISILVLGIVSMFAMYSTDGGEFKYHTNSHILMFFVFFGLLGLHVVFFSWVMFCSTSPPGGSQVDGLPPAQHIDAVVLGWPIGQRLLRKSMFLNSKH